MRTGPTRFRVAAIVVVIVVSWWWDTADRASGPVPGSPGRAHVEDLLDRVRVVAARTDVPGYVRDCDTGGGCVFGPAWSDDHPGPGGHDGCDTRNNVLARDLREVVSAPGTAGCVVTAGLLTDPYTGAQLRFRRSDAAAIHIDHIYPLAAAWDHGAAVWPDAVRRRFANDIGYNLLAVDGTVNRAKSDHTPAGWLPPEPGRRCWFAGRYLTVAIRYGLPVSADDHRALTAAAALCPSP